MVQGHLAVTNCLRYLEIAPVDRSTLGVAATNPGADFEDNLQIACAVASGLDAIITRNTTDFTGSPIPILTPAELLVLLSRTPG